MKHNVANRVNQPGTTLYTKNAVAAQPPSERPRPIVAQLLSSGNIYLDDPVPGPVASTKWPANTTFYPGKDSGGRDIERRTNLDDAELYSACIETPGCVGFNTNGYLKNYIVEPAAFSTWTTDPTKGLVVFDKELRIYTALRHALIGQHNPQMEGTIKSYYNYLEPQSRNRIYDQAMKYLKAKPVESIDLARQIGFGKQETGDVSLALATWIGQLSDSQRGRPLGTTGPLAARAAQVALLGSGENQTRNLVLGLLILAAAGTAIGYTVYRQRQKDRVIRV